MHPQGPVPSTACLESAACGTGSLISPALARDRTSQKLDISFVKGRPGLARIVHATSNFFDLDTVLAEGGFQRDAGSVGQPPYGGGRNRAGHDLAGLSVAHHEY